METGSTATQQSNTHSKPYFCVLQLNLSVNVCSLRKMIITQTFYRDMNMVYLFIDSEVESLEIFQNSIGL